MIMCFFIKMLMMTTSFQITVFMNYSLSDAGRNRSVPAGGHGACKGLACGPSGEGDKRAGT